MYTRRYSRTSTAGAWIYSIAFIVTISLVMLACVAEIIIQNSYKETITVTVGSTEVKMKSGEKTQTYLVNVIFPDGNTEVLESSDSLVQGKWNSADVYFKLKDSPGKVFKLTVVGVRYPLLSWNRNIIAVEGPIE